MPDEVRPDCEGTRSRLLNTLPCEDQGHMDQDPSQQEGRMSNGRNKVTIEYDVTDLPMIAHAFLLAGNRAMMSGAPEAEARLRVLEQTIQAMIPEEARLFHALHWAEIGTALEAGSEWKVEFVETEGVWTRQIRNGHILVTVGDKVYRSEKQVSANSPALEAVTNLLNDLAPIETTFYRPGM